MSNEARARAWVEIDVGALRANYEMVRRTVGRAAAIIPMVKANGYGLGAERVVRALEPLGPWGYGVAAVGEGVELRREGVDRPVIVFGPMPPDAVELAAEARLTASISDLGELERWARAAERSPGPLDFHLEVDTGMGRAGFDWRRVGEWAEAVAARVGPKLRWTGVYTHFQGADAVDQGPTAIQWERFQEVLARLPVARERIMVHACNSAAALRWPEYVGDAVRPGIFLYGGHPAVGVEGVPAPRPVVAVRARVVLVREVPPGSTVGYGATHVAGGWERWATLSIGYGDGFPRALGNCGAALVRGRRVPIIGRISMDMTVVDVTTVPEVQVGDVATLIGRDGSEELTVEEVAAHAGTISYEILTRLGTRLNRVELEHGIDG
jgi:alanine racemase